MDSNIKTEANSHNQDLDSYKIDMIVLPRLSELKYLPVSVSQDKVNRLLVGKWVVFIERADYTEKNMIEFGKNNKIISSTISKNFYDDRPDWEFEVHDHNYSSFNSFNVNGMSTMQIVYIDRYILYARTHNDIIFIKEDSIDKFKDYKAIVNYLFNEEKYWRSLYGNFNSEKQIDDDDDKIKLWSLWFVLTCGASYSLVKIMELNGYISIVISGIVIAAILFIYSKIHKRQVLKEYISENPDSNTSLVLKAILDGKIS